MKEGEHRNLVPSNSLEKRIIMERSTKTKQKRKLNNNFETANRSPKKNASDLCS